MAKQCVWNPGRSKSGDEKGSKLYQSLLAFTNNDRKDALKMYFYIIGDDFKSAYKNIIKYNDEGEPELSSILGKVDVKGIIDDASNSLRILRKAGEEIDGRARRYADSAQNYIELSNKAISINDSGEYSDYIAVVRKDDTGLFLSIERSNENNRKLARDIKYNSVLNSKIKDILSALGIDLESIYSLEDELNENGVVDYKNAEVLANGLLKLIRLANNSEGEKALPEEFSHFMLDVMRDNPIIKRLISAVKKNELYKEILGEEYENYLSRYGDDEDRLVREAAGKLVSQSLVGENSIVKKHKTLLENVIEAIKSFVRRIFNPNDITNAIEAARSTAYTVANIITSEEAKQQNIRLEELKQFKNLNQLAKKAKTAEQIVSGSIDKALKKYTFYIEALKRQIANESDQSKKRHLEDVLAVYETKAQNFILEQRTNLQNGTFNSGVAKFIQEASTELSKCVEKLTDILSNKYSQKEAIYQLRNIRNIINSNKELTDSIMASKEYAESGIELTEEIESLLGNLAAKLATADTLCKQQSLEYFSKFLESYMPEEGIEYNKSTFEKEDGKRVFKQGRVKITKRDIASLLETAQRDISIVDSWLNSAAETGDIIMKLSDAAVKEKKDSARQETVAIQKELLAAAKKYKDATGTSNTDYIFERHSDGSLSNRYKSEINWTAWYDSRAELEKRIKDTGVSPKEARELRRLWRNENCTSTGMPSYKYRDANFKEKMSAPEREYYDKFMEIRSRLISYLPTDTYSSMDPMKAVQITKDMWEKFRTLPLGKLPASVWQTVKEQTVGKPDDTEYGNQVKTTFSGEQQLGLPIFYIKDVEEQYLSRDTVSTLVAFADMATNYQRMSEVVDIFELGRDVVAERKAYYTKGGKKLRETLKAFGHKAEIDATHTATEFIKRFNHFVDSQVYSKYMQGQEIPGTNIKANKVSNFLIKWTSLTSLALNGLAGTAAVINDMINIDNEALSKRQFDGKQLLQADKIYATELAGLLGESGNPIKTNKLSLFIEKFDVLHEYEIDAKNIEWGRSRAKRLASSNALYLFMHMGSHFGETRTALAQALNTQITSDDGTKTKNLWDILHVKYIDENDHSLGATLEVEEGFSLKEKDITKYSRKFMALNERLFGAYNKADRNMLQSTAVGQLVMLFRKFMIPAVNRRFRGGDYNIELGEETEGFYVTFGKFLYNLATDAKGYGRSLKLYKQDLNDYELQNLRRAERELSVYVALIIATSLMDSADWDKKKNPWGKRFTAYMGKRAKMEVGAFTPFGLFGETMNLLKSPMASINTIENAGDLIDLTNPWAWNTEVKSGRYKGHSKAYKSLMQNIPMNKTIYKLSHPEESMIAFR